MKLKGKQGRKTKTQGILHYSILWCEIRTTLPPCAKLPLWFLPIHSESLTISSNHLSLPPFLLSIAFGTLGTMFILVGRRVEEVICWIFG